MSLEAILLRAMFTRGDTKRDKGLTTPLDVTRHTDISYGTYGPWSLLDVCLPQNVPGSLPVIVSVHGGGYVYGTKEVYQHYCCDLALRGFAVINFNYRLAPKHKYPAPLQDLNSVLHWVADNADNYRLDTKNVFLVGDSAGAQITSQYAVILTNPEYAALFDLALPAVTVRAIGLNCGIYSLNSLGAVAALKGLFNDYFGKDITIHGNQLAVCDYIDANYPPASITTAENDFLRDMAQPLSNLLDERHVENEVRIYGSKQDKSTAHVFHINVRNAAGRQCNDEQCAFFRKHCG